jgi:hypothetical protein
MIWRNPVIWRLGIASIALLVAVGIYLFTRLNPPPLLQPFQVTSALSGTQTGLPGSTPSFFYTLSIGLLIGVCASTQSSARLHCLLWTGLALALELSQAEILGIPISVHLAETLPDSIWQLVGPYWTRGVFDPLDLLATLLGGAIALAMLTYMPWEKTSEA